MSDSLQFTKIIQDELRTMHDRNQQIETMLEMNRAGMATITDLLNRHPALQNCKEIKETVVETKQNSPASDKVKSMLLESKAPKQMQSGDSLLKSYNLSVDKLITDVNDHSWLKVSDGGDGQQFNYTLLSLFKTYASPALTKDIGFSILCRGFIQADIEKVKSDIDFEFRPYPLNVHSIPYVQERRLENITSNNIMEILFSDRATGFYTIAGHTPEDHGLWLVLNCADAFVIFDLHAKDEESFVSVYISDIVDTDLTYINNLFQLAKTKLLALAMKAMTIF